MHQSAVVLFFISLSLLCATPAHAEISLERKTQLIHLLRQDCGSCHGMTMNGGLGPPLTPQALLDKPEDLLENTIFYGLPERAMPGWQGLLTREEIHWLVEQLKKGEFP
ncbi:MAG: cytochrome c [Magnetococcales bacterium]|nr:cytochrome c [Magnetococcales bacterium]